MADIKNAREGIVEEKNWKFYEQNTGIAGQHCIEPQLKYKQEQNEKVINSPNGAQIVLGRDEYYGFLGNSKASSIDLVVGRGSSIDSTIRPNKENLFVKSDKKNDAARIFISQKTDLDKLFEMPIDNLIKTPKACSGIGIKADTIRMISRHNVKIQAACDKILSNELRNPEKVGIDLISGVPFDGEENYNEEMGLVEGRDDMQPIPKGKNLEEALDKIIDLLDSVSGVLINFIKLQQQFNNDIGSHTHLETFYGNQGISSIDIIGPLLENNISILEESTTDSFEFKVKYLGSFKDTYLNESSSKYINSKYHRLN